MIIGINGKKSSGKNTVYDIIKKYSELTNYPKLIVESSFARLVKESAAASLGIEVATLEKLKNEKEALVSLSLYGINTSQMTVREYLQKYGTEAHRDVFDNDFWVDQLLPLDHTYDDVIYIITDARFLNEINRIKQLANSKNQTEIWKIVRPSLEDKDLHISEKDLPDKYCDRIIINDGTMEDLEKKVISAFIRSQIWYGDKELA